jgi:hypothetical protein
VKKTGKQFDAVLMGKKHVSLYEQILCSKVIRKDDKREGRGGAKQFATLIISHHKHIPFGDGTKLQTELRR